MDAADSAEDALAAALAQAKDASMGNISEASMANGAAEDTGAPGNPDDPPNIEEVAWQSDAMKAYYQGLFGTFWNTSSFGNGEGFGDRYATPE
jgi:hypothetical protein